MSECWKCMLGLSSPNRLLWPRTFFLLPLCKPHTHTHLRTQWSQGSNGSARAVYISMQANGATLCKLEEIYTLAFDGRSWVKLLPFARSFFLGVWKCTMCAPNSIEFEWACVRSHRSERVWFEVSSWAPHHHYHHCHRGRHSTVQVFGRPVQTIHFSGQLFPTLLLDPHGLIRNRPVISFHSIIPVAVCREEFR